MRSNAQWHARNPLLKIAILACAGLLLTVALLYLLVRHPKSSDSTPPDLSACTRLRVHYDRGALHYFFPVLQESVLSEKERKYVQSYDTWTVRDRQHIKAFAHLVSQGTYEGIQPGVTEIDATIIGYRGIFGKVSLTVHDMGMVISNKHVFRYPPHFLGLASLDPPGFEPLGVRWKCARNLSSLVYRSHVRERYSRRNLDPNHWCDTIVEYLRNEYTIHGELNSGKKERDFPDDAIARMFTCRGVHATTDVNNAPSPPHETPSSSQAPSAWISDYAMNPNCREESHPHIVLLFETKPGWNQHGGPELFTFDNHIPKGGLVLLNDGTVKFVRTEEELKQLRWK